MKIGVFDSGIGGLTVLKEVRKLLPEYDYIYYGDSKNNPYGNKPEEELFSIVVEIVEFLIMKGCKLIVIACNTATTRCRKRLIEKYPDIIFVGVVPAIKVACDNDYKNILVLATPSTVSSSRVREIIDSSRKINQQIYLLSCDGLANAIENEDYELVDKLLYYYCNEYVNMDIDCVVLGCTHYPLIEKNIQNIFPSSKIINGNLGVAREVERQLVNHNIFSNKQIGTIKIYNSLNNKNM